MSQPACSFSTALPLEVFTRSAGPEGEWQPFDQGPGYFNIPADHLVRLKVRSIGNQELAQLAADAAACPAVVELDLAENRKITDAGLAKITGLQQLTGLRVSACDLSDAGMKHLVQLGSLRRLDLSYCNRITDQALRTLASLRQLEFLDLQGCSRITHAGAVRLQRPGLDIHRPTKGERNQPRPTW